MTIQILLHSSKTMRAQAGQHVPLATPHFIAQAAELAAMWQQASPQQIVALMKVSSAKATQVSKLFAHWYSGATSATPAIDAFIGDIYSGLQVGTWSASDREYAHDHLLILSGLYGALRACDGVLPYRLEMGYKLPNGMNMYQFWGDSIAQLLSPSTDCIVNLSAVEYTKAVLPYVKVRVITPKFLTISPKTGEPVFVTVHAKIARGAFARWLITQRISNIGLLCNFTDLNYCYDPIASTPDQPVFVCKKFGGLGLSVRLAK